MSASKTNAEDAKVLAKAAKKARLRVPLRQPWRPLRLIWAAGSLVAAWPRQDFALKTVYENRT
jgi:hypothetical protein